MNYATSITERSESLVLRVLAELKNGQIREAVNDFGDKFKFTDYGIGVEFDGRERLTEFFQKTRELYPDSVLTTETIFVSREDVITQWTVRKTISEPYFGGQTRKVPVVIHGVSVVRTEDGKITRWSDYYDGLTARRTALGAYFTDWVEL
jgi:steroid delta-isomerase-like uncharacterized protein